jgi:serine/threonine-protein kinase
MTAMADSGPEERRDRAERLYDEARSLTARERAGFIEETCGGDDALRAELAELLEHGDAAERFFARLGDIVAALPVGSTVVAGRYEIGARIGAGGMGVVYRAHDRLLQRDVALKFLPSHLAGTTDAEHALLREARAAAALEHANICTVHEVGSTEDGRPFISMSLYEGESLKDRLRRGPIPVAEAIDAARQLASGLAAAHERGIVHRDVKPGNVMILRDRVVKLLDFGLARLSDAAVTGPGPVPGTVAYMSPEQLKGDAVGPASDLFSLGVVMYEMVAGLRPFRGETPVAVMQAILHHEPEPLRSRNPATSAAIERIVARLLQKRPQARHATARELLADLDTLHSADVPAGRRRRAWSRRPWLVAAGILLPVVAVLSALLVFSSREPANVADAAVAGAATPIPDKAVAVLPFGNVGRDPEDDYLVDGLTEELIGALSRVRSLRVVARTSAFAFKDARRDIREIGATLGVDAILEGSVQRSGDRIRVRAQLINVVDGLNLWSEAYDREVDDIFAVQQDLASRIATSMQAGLSTPEREQVEERRTVDPEAYNLYLKGRHFWNQRTSSAFARALDYYERAIEIDSGFAAAYAGLAAVYSQQGLWGDLPSAVAGERMRTAATRAVELDDRLAEAHAVLGAYMHVYAWDSAAAEREQRRAIELDPAYVTARYYYGNLLRAHGQLDEAIAQYRIAARLDPLDPLVGDALGRTLILAGRLVEARQYVLGALELDSMFWWPHGGLGAFHEAQGQFEEALREYRRASELGGSVVHVARLLARTDHEPEAREILVQLQRDAERTGIHPPEVASILFALHDADAAMVWLEQAYRERHPMLRFIAGRPEYTPLEADPRFVDLLRRIGLRN